MQEAQFDTGDALEEVQQFLQENSNSLRAIACVYVVRMGLASEKNLQVIAEEIFQDAVLEVLTRPERFAAVRQPRAWFMGILANMVKRKRAGAARRYRFEVLLSDLRHLPDLEDENDLLDQLMSQQSPGPEQVVEMGERLQEMLALVSDEDAELLKLALVEELGAQKLGKLLGITPNAARVRVHRALSRLRLAWKQVGQNEKRGERNG